MQRKQLTFIFIILAVSIIVVLALHLYTKSRMLMGNGFLRKFPENLVISTYETDLGLNSFHLVAITPQQVFLGNPTTPLRLYTYDTLTNAISPFPLKFDRADELTFKQPLFTINAPYIYLSDGALGLFMAGDIDKKSLLRLSEKKYFQTHLQPVNPTTFIRRVYSEKESQSVLSLLSIRSDVNSVFPDLLQKQLDGIFCTDGMLHYNQQLHKMVYVYYYRNEFFCTDSSLHLQYRGNTIDTIRQAQISVTHLSSENSSVMASPPLIVNRKSCTYGQWLYINSGLIADNESQQKFTESAVIDVYDLNDGMYQFSFYLEHFRSKDIQSLQATKNKIMFISGNKLVTYVLNLDET